MNLFKEAEPRVYEAMSVAEQQLKTFDLGPKLKELIKIRASQLNGCGYCIDMHAQSARKLGEREQRIYALSAWWETPFFTEEEQIVLKLTEEITHISNGGIPDDVRERALQLLGEQKFAQVVFTITVINSWNRIAISTHMMPEED